VTRSCPFPKGCFSLHIGKYSINHYIELVIVSLPGSFDVRQKFAHLAVRRVMRQDGKQMFLETVMVDGQAVPRFRYVGGQE